ncbi:MAG TPA: hypothetical protein EYO51_03050 [Methylococcaceae bacterium]|jgi:flagellar biosynthesis/type III secretory pathway chaperone|nr:hypothetical protein [Methylococcaceae bacterium]HIN68989.1 hypothetical protein [Methylococcales bacterium]HIA44662.1 hypothetical protein [Methylococcaceae bacterium]HIB62118.1 hypothetical protein [Methylococcaceae bacterium]HIO12934.1 hypothetical protein [Methylococcales bacterium]
MIFEEQVEIAIALALKLETLLTSEYSSLKIQDISAFQNIQSTKTDLLLQLQLFDQHKKDFVEKHKVMGTPPKIEPFLEGDSRKNWIYLTEILSRCQTQHRKTEIYLDQKIKTTHNVLEVLTLTNQDHTTKLYNESGKNTIKTLGNIIDEG